MNLVRVANWTASCLLACLGIFTRVESQTAAMFVRQVLPERAQVVGLDDEKPLQDDAQASDCNACSRTASAPADFVMNESNCEQSSRA